jgi:glycosyltransferase involved in cell wall biosynthesis
MISSLSIVIPVYNESAAIPQLLIRLEAALSAMKLPQAECLIVDDGSTDESPQLLREAARNHAFLKPILRPERKGKSAALLAGFNAAKGEYIATLDGDLQNDPMDLPILLAALEEQNADVIVGWRVIRHDPVQRQIFSRCYNYLLSGMFGVPLHDHNCGMKIFRKSILSSLTLQGEWHRYFMVLAHHAGYRCAEAQISHYPRPYGRSRYGLFRYVEIVRDVMMLLMRGTPRR